LTVVLPMSALFSVALIYGRFASDNELAACKASGISLTTLVYPGLCLAVVVAITNLILSFYVVPAFVMRAEKSVQGNAKQIVFRNIQRKGYYEMPGKRFQIYADHAFPESDTLKGVVVIESKGGEITRQIFAKYANIIIKTESDFTQVTAIAHDTYQLDKNDDPQYAESLSVLHRFPPMLSDNIKFQKIDRLKEIRADMSKFTPVREKILDARVQLAAEALAEDISKKLARPNAGYYQLRSQDKIFRIYSKSCKAGTDSTIAFESPVELLEYDSLSHLLSMTWTSDDPAKLVFVSEQPDSMLGLVLTNVSYELNENVKSPAPAIRRVFPDILLTPEVSNKLNYKKTEKRSLIDTIATINNPDEEDPIITGKPSKTLIKLKKAADYEIWVTSKKILSEVHTRLVFGIGSITLILFAVALGIVFKGGHLLSAFGASAIPAAALIVFIMSGKELTKTRNAAMPEHMGIIVMWSGLVALSIIAFLIFRKLTRT
jgi:lipopolysaccharide export LptBFGC system permease protein LptF